jgi:type II secretion system protein G
MNMNRKPPTPRTIGGFTLIELLIVVAIIAILAAIALPNFIEAQTRSKVARALADMRSIATAIETYAVDYNSYPRDGDDLESANPFVDFEVSRRLSVLTTPLAYLTTLPSDPFNIVKPNLTDPLDPRGFFFPGEPPYTYAYSTFGSFFEDPIRQQPANGGNPDNFTLISLGPNLLFDSDQGAAKLQYDPTNGTTSAGDLFYSGGLLVNR